MHTSAQITRFPRQKRQPINAAPLADEQAAPAESQAEFLNACNAELAKLIQELRKHVPNYVRI